MAEPSASAPAETSVSAPKCSNCHCNPIAAEGLYGFDDWCADCDASLHASKFVKAAVSATIATDGMCTICLCRPKHPKSDFDDLCSECDSSMRASTDYLARCDRAMFPRPPPHPLGRAQLICPCGFFAVHNRHLARPRAGKENLPLHQLVSVPLSPSAHIVLCLICDQTFKHHRNAVKHMQSHHTHFHAHHGPR